MEDKSIILYIELMDKEHWSFNSSNLTRLKNIFHNFEVLDVDNFSSKKLIKAIEPLLLNKKKIIVFNCKSPNVKLNALTSFLLQLKQEQDNSYYLLGTNQFLEGAFNPQRLVDINEIITFI